MKQAYTDELKALEVSIDSLKQRMEAWYAKRLEDKDLVDENPDKIEYTSLMTEADQLTTNMQNSTKLVKNAIVPRLFIGSSLNTKQSLLTHLSPSQAPPKPKAKPKADPPATVKTE